jgi:hypothetical protein
VLAFVFEKDREMSVLSQDEPEPAIVVRVVRYRCGHESVLGAAKVIAGALYVLAHHTDSDFRRLVNGLAETGHAFTVEIVTERVGVLEMAERKGL